MLVIKSGGCNHMKCSCGAAFCWLCGKQIDDALFPAHFQWWNPSGCSNLQMNEASTPSQCSIICARLSSVLQLIVLGPLTVVSTVVFSLVCLPCIAMHLYAEDQSSPAHNTVNSPNKPDLMQNKPAATALEGASTCKTWFTGLMTVLSLCMTSWGVFWMLLLFALPLGLALLASAGSLCLAVLIAITPFYILYRLCHRQYPWPDAWSRCCTDHLHACRWRYRLLYQHHPLRRRSSAHSEVSNSYAGGSQSGVGSLSRSSSNNSILRALNSSVNNTGGGMNSGSNKSHHSASASASAGAAAVVMLLPLQQSQQGSNSSSNAGDDDIIDLEMQSLQPQQLSETTIMTTDPPSEEGQLMELLHRLEVKDSQRLSNNLQQQQSIMESIRLEILEHDNHHSQQQQVIVNNIETLPV
jgi:hypothetical protein